jgi:hypothetical protein
MFSMLILRSSMDHGKRYWTTVSTKDEFLVFGGERKLGVKGYMDASFQTTTSRNVAISSFRLEER